jgi:signal recognition particle subunit SRP54
VQENKMKRCKFILQSMTPEEKAKPETINSSRINRIAKGSACDESEVRELLANYNKTKKMMKRFSPEKMKRSGFLKQFGLK